MADMRIVVKTGLEKVKLELCQWMVSKQKKQNIVLDIDKLKGGCFSGQLDEMYGTF